MVGHGLLYYGQLGALGRVQWKRRLKGVKAHTAEEGNVEEEQRHTGGWGGRLSM